jgi:hypothetical protein
MGSHHRRRVEKASHQGGANWLGIWTSGQCPFQDRGSGHAHRKW